MSSEVQIGRLRADEAAGLIALLVHARLPLEGVREHLRDALVARADGRILGSAVLEPYGEAVLLRSVAVDESRRGQGLGARLTAAALDLARQNGARRAYLLTETAGGFFERLGFRTIPREEVPDSVRASVEFTTACPASARVMEAAL